MKVARRVVTALAVAAAVACALIYLPLSAVKPALIVLAALVHLEYSQMVAKKYPVMVVPGVAAGVLYLVSAFYFYDNCFAPLMFALAAAALFRKGDRPVAAWATTVLGFVYVPMMVNYFHLIAQRFGLVMLLYVIAIVKISDRGGFAFGMAFGRHKMCPSISPKKSWEGMAGSVFASCLISCLFMPVTHFTPVRALLFGVAAAICGTLGDLVESRIKRECEVKDSATFMPAGMGGFLDMFDSLLFAPALFYSFL